MSDECSCYQVHCVAFSDNTYSISALSVLFHIAHQVFYIITATSVALSVISPIPTLLLFLSTKWQFCGCRNNPPSEFWLLTYWYTAALILAGLWHLICVKMHRNPAEICTNITHIAPLPGSACIPMCWGGNREHAAPPISKFVHVVKFRYILTYLFLILKTKCSGSTVYYTIHIQHWCLIVLAPQHIIHPLISGNYPHIHFSFLVIFCN